MPRKGYVERHTGYVVWLFREKYWHRTFAGALRRSKRADKWCSGDDNLIVEVTSARRMHRDGSYMDPSED